MNNNLTYEVVKKEIQKKLVSFLYQNNEVTINEFEILISKFDEQIKKIKEQIVKEKDNYIYPIKLNIVI